MDEREPEDEARPKLLIVEDDDAYRAALLRAAQRVTRDRGWEIAAVANLHDGETALQNVTVNLILTDYHLPDGLGTALTARTSPDRGRTRRVVLTGAVERVARAFGDTPLAFDDLWDKNWELSKIEEHLDAAMARVEFNRFWA